jgi:hypothetical protein
VDYPKLPRLQKKHYNIQLLYDSTFETLTCAGERRNPATGIIWNTTQKYKLENLNDIFETTAISVRSKKTEYAESFIGRCGNIIGN